MPPGAVSGGAEEEGTGAADPDGGHPQLGGRRHQDPGQRRLHVPGPDPVCWQRGTAFSVPCISLAGGGLLQGHCAWLASPAGDTASPSSFTAVGGVSLESPFRFLGIFVLHLGSFWGFSYRLQQMRFNI